MLMLKPLECHHIAKNKCNRSAFMWLYVTHEIQGALSGVRWNVYIVPWIRVRARKCSRRVRHPKFRSSDAMQCAISRLHRSLLHEFPQTGSMDTALVLLSARRKSRSVFPGDQAEHNLFFPRFLGDGRCALSVAADLCGWSQCAQIELDISGARSNARGVGGEWRVGRYVMGLDLAAERARCNGECCGKWRVCFWSVWSWKRHITTIFLEHIVDEAFILGYMEYIRNSSRKDCILVWKQTAMGFVWLEKWG